MHSASVLPNHTLNVTVLLFSTMAPHLTLKLHLLTCSPLSLFLIIITSALAGNILFVPLTGEGSHVNVMNAMATEMVVRGHNITMLVSSHYKETLSSVHGNERYHFEVFKPSISLESRREYLKNMTNAGLKGKYTEWLIKMFRSDHVRSKSIEYRMMLSDKDLMSRLRDSNFDLAVADISHLCPTVQYLRKHMGIPFVATSCTLTISGGKSLGNRLPFNPSYIPEALTAFDHVMSFQERLINTGWALFITGVRICFSNSFEELRHEFDIADTTHYYDDAELFLINSHFSLDFPKPTLPSTIMVGGLTTGPSQTLDTVSSLNSMNEYTKTLSWFYNKTENYNNK